jgi:hypothetical protein
LDWNLHWIIISPYYRNGKNGTPAGKDICHGGKDVLSTQGGNADMRAWQKEMEGQPISSERLSRKDGGESRGNEACRSAGKDSVV